MKVRRKVMAPSLSDYFRFQSEYFTLEENLYYNTQIFNKVTFITFFLIACLFLGILNPLFLATGGAVFCLILYLYLKTQNIANSLSITRATPKYAREKQEIEIVYTLTNESAMSVSGFEFIQNFDGISSQFFKVLLKKEIPPHTRLNIKKNIKLDAGMGVKSFSPIKLFFEDELNIFRFTVQFFEENEIEVYPLIQELPHLQTAISQDSIDFGLFEISKRGDSNLFIGTREYRQGDLVKNVNWKLSKKNKKLVVNEFEKSTNTYITIYLDLKMEHQLGFGENSSWESAKDLALSIVANETARHNFIQIISNNLYIPFGTGKSHMSLIEKHFTYHEMVSSNILLAASHINDLPKNGQIYYICPMHASPTAIETFDMLQKIKSSGQSLYVLVLNPYKELKKKLKGEMKLTVMESERFAQKEFEKISNSFKLSNIPCFLLEVSDQQTLVQSYFHETKHFWEKK